MSNDQPTNWKRWWTMPVLIFAGILLPGLAAPDAHADTSDQSFLTVINSQGISYTSVSEAVAAGHLVCQFLDAGYSVNQVAVMVYTNAHLSAYQAGYFTGASVGAYCPQYGYQIGGGSSGGTSGMGQIA
jgi:hypothetical protein